MAVFIFGFDTVLVGLFYTKLLKFGAVQQISQIYYETNGRCQISSN